MSQRLVKRGIIRCQAGKGFLVSKPRGGTKISRKVKPFQPIIINDFLDNIPFTGDVSFKQDFKDISTHLQAIVKTGEGQQLVKKIGSLAVKIKNSTTFKEAISFCFNMANKLCEDNPFVAGLLFICIILILIDVLFNSGSITRTTINKVIMPIFSQLKYLGIPGIMALPSLYGLPSEERKSITA